MRGRGSTPWANPAVNQGDWASAPDRFFQGEVANKVGWDDGKSPSNHIGQDVVEPAARFWERRSLC